MNRIIHRLGAILAVLLMLWLSGTGSTIQMLDLKTVLSHTDPTDPTAVSMAEGMYGPRNYSVIQLSDFHAGTFNRDFDISQAVGTVLQAARRDDNDTGAVERDRGRERTNTTAWVELRVVDGVPIGQVMKGGELHAFNAQTGDSVAALAPEPIPQGGRLPPSLRQKVKTLHRFWNRGDTPGVYFELLSGLVLWMLIITGLVMYFRLLSARARIGRKQLFWLSGGIWRGVHRAVSIAAAAFLLCIAFSGTWIGYESSWSALERPVQVQPAPQDQPPAGAGQGRNRVNPLSDAEVQNMTATTLAAMERLHPGMPIKVLRLRTYGEMKQGVVIGGGQKTDQLVFNTDTGEPASLTEPHYPKSNFPFGIQMHENMKHFHSGELFGIPGQLMNLFAGLSLLFLSISGLTVYVEMWLKRRKSGRKNFLWK